MTRYASISVSRSTLSTPETSAAEAPRAPLTTGAFIWPIIHRARMRYSPHDHGIERHRAVSLGRNRARKSHRIAVTQDRVWRARNAGPGVRQTRLPRADARARERADGVRAAGRVE